MPAFESREDSVGQQPSCTTSSGNTSREGTNQGSGVRFSQDIEISERIQWEEPSEPQTIASDPTLIKLVSDPNLVKVAIDDIVLPPGTSASAGASATSSAVNSSLDRNSIATCNSYQEKSTNPGQMSVSTSYTATSHTVSSADHRDLGSMASSEDSIMESVQRKIDKLTDFDRNFAPVLGDRDPVSKNKSVISTSSREIAEIVQSGRGMKRLVSTLSFNSDSKNKAISFRTAVTVPVAVFILGVCLGLFLPLFLLSDNARDEMLDSLWLVEGEHRRLVNELLQASSGALAERLSNSVSYVESLAKAAQEKSEDRSRVVIIFGIVYFIALFLVTIGFCFALSWFLSSSLFELKFLMDGLGELKFNKDSLAFRRIKYGNRSNLKDVAELQESFLGVSRGMEAFVRFVPESTVRDIVKGEQKATRLHVARRIVTIMFCDIRDFTTISEMLNQSDLLFLLTRYFSVMTRIVSSFDGVVAEILGDGLLCFWNTPDDCEDHAAKACAASLAMNQALSLMSAEFGKLELPPLAIRIGIHTGSVLTGNIGSELKMKFGCIGDPVNLAARLEGLCKFYRVSILCSGDTHRALPKRGFTCRRLDLVQVKGKNEPCAIFEVIDCAITHELDDGTGSGPAESLDTDVSGLGTSSADSGADSIRARMRNVRKSMRKSIRSASNQGSCSSTAGSSTPLSGRNRCTLQLAVALEAIDDSNKAMTSAQACRDMWDPIRQKFGAVKTGMKNGLQALKPANIMGSSPSTPSLSRKTANTSPRTVTGRISTVVDLSRPEQSQRRIVQIKLYEDALQAYQDARFVAARDLLDELLRQTPDDGPAVRLKDRLNRYIGPDGRMVGLSLEALADWTGVYLMTEK